MNQPTSTKTQQAYDLTEVKQRTDAALQAFFDEQITRAQLTDPSYAQLWTTLQQVTMGGGKRIRPYLVVLAYTACGGTQPNEVIPVAAAHELLHQCLLIHDDIIDRDTTRHSQPNVTGHMLSKYAALGNNARHYADSAALLAGDLALAGAHRMVYQSSLTAEQKLLALRRIYESIYTVGAGELMDTDSVISDPSATDVIKIATLKTTHYSFIEPLLTGAELGGAAPTQVEGLAEYGKNLGIAFQLCDDLLGVFGNEAETGKSTTSDLREGKHTYLLQQTLQAASPEQLAILQQHIGDPGLTAEKAQVVRSVMEATGARAKTETRIEHYAAAASQALDNLQFSPELRAAFAALITKATKRSS